MLPKFAKIPYFSLPCVRGGVLPKARRKGLFYPLLPPASEQGKFCRHSPYGKRRAFYACSSFSQKIFVKANLFWEPYIRGSCRTNVRQKEFFLKNTAPRANLRGALFLIASSISIFLTTAHRGRSRTPARLPKARSVRCRCTRRAARRPNRCHSRSACTPARRGGCNASRRGRLPDPWG